MALSDYTDQFISFYTRSISTAINLVEYTAKLNKYQATANMISAMVDTISQLKQLRHFTLEAINTQIEDEDFLLFAKGACKFPHIEHLTVKVIQYPNLSEKCIFEYADYISKCDNLKKIDLYFRRLSLLPEEILNLGNKLLTLKNLGYCAVNQSLHVYRNL